MLVKVRLTLSGDVCAGGHDYDYDYCHLHNIVCRMWVLYPSSRTVSTGFGYDGEGGQVNNKFGPCMRLVHLIHCLIFKL